MYKKANVWLGLFLFIFRFSRFQKLAANHKIAIDLEDPKLGLEYQKEKYRPDERDALESAFFLGKKLRSSLGKSLFAVFITFVVALFLTFFEGSVSPSLSISWKKIVEILAAFLLMWSTLFELGWGLRTWKGQALHELVHSLLFKCLFVSGSFFLMVALLIT